MKVSLDDFMLRSRVRLLEDFKDLIACTLALSALLSDVMHTPLGVGPKGPHFIATEECVINCLTPLAE